MAVKSRSGSSVLKFLRFVVRFLGLNGLVAAAVGVILWKAFDYEQVGLIVLLSGAGAVALALLAEVRGLAGAVASHRGFAGINVMLQVALAAALVGGGNYYSFEHYKRFDLTEKQTFTLPERVRENLAKLRGDTDIIVYLQHVSFGQRVDLRQDDYDQAAEKVVTRKIEDLVEQFSEISPRFRVTVLDTQKKNKKAVRNKINELSGEWTGAEHPAKDSALLKTIEKAPEDSIFFYSNENKQLQRLSFNDIYNLDRKASEEANNGNGNLVLIDQGVQTFADKVFKLEEKKPRIGIAVAHPWLGQGGPEEFGMPGLKEALASRGFEGRDIILKKYPEFEPAALEADEGRYEELDAQIASLKESIKEAEDDLAAARKSREFWHTKSNDEVNKEYALVRTQFGVQPVRHTEIDAYRKQTGKTPITGRVTEAYQQAWAKDLADDIDFLDTEIPQARKQLDSALAEQGKLRVDNLGEQRRITDLRGKFNRLLADVDLLVVPRWTVVNVVLRRSIDLELYSLKEAQLEAIKDYIRAGKPVLFCLGPMLEAGESPPPAQGDSLERMLEEFNIQMPNQVILFKKEADAMAERNMRSQMRGGTVDIPPAEFTWKLGPGSRLFRGMDLNAGPPIRTSMKLTADGLGAKSLVGLKIRHPRPVYVARTTWDPDALATAVGSLALPLPNATNEALAVLLTQMNKKFDEKAVFLMTPADCWNEDRPFPTERWKPHFVRPKSDDPNKGTLQEKRRGPFPIGVALEAEVPLDWYDKGSEQTPKKVRLAVIGQGGLFIGDKLPPLREKLFFDVANWLLGRDNLLAHEGATWQYPRVHLEPEVKNMWEWGARLGLPLVFVCLGMNVWLVRRMR